MEIGLEEMVYGRANHGGSEGGQGGRGDQGTIHWGIHFVPKVTADFQTTISKAAFSAGARLIVDHHAHVPKAIAYDNGKVCLYSLSNFIMGSRVRSEEGRREFERRYGARHDPEYPHLVYGEDTKRNLNAKAVISRSGVDGVSFLPVTSNFDRKLCDL